MMRILCPAVYVVLLCFCNSSSAQVDRSRGGPVPAERLLERYTLNTATPAKQTIESQNSQRWIR